MIQPTEHLVQGVDHAAFPTFEPLETVRFYHEILGFPIVHSVCAVGWGPEDHPDFIHFFFDVGQGDRIAFFYYFGMEPLAEPGRDAYSNHGQDVPKFFRDSRHLALHVESAEVLEEYQRRLEGAGWKVEYRVAHETIESIYTYDPNGYLVEFTYPTRETTEKDDHDAELTIKALIDIASSDEPSLVRLWERKAEFIAAEASGQTSEGESE